MVAIESRYIGQTNHRSSRYSATVMEPRVDSFGNKRRSITIAQDDRLNSEQNHVAAIRALIVKLGWNDPGLDSAWHIGGTERGYVAVAALDYARIDFNDRRHEVHHTIRSAWRKHRRETRTS